MRSAVRVVTVGFLICGMLAALGCEDSTPRPEVREAVEARVKAYLDALAVAYSSLDASVLEPYAMGAEVAAVRTLLRTLLGSGDRIEARLLQVELEKVDVFRMVNATVRTMEVWEVTRYDPYTGREKGRNSGSVQHSILQLRLVEDEWMVTARRVLEADGESRWGVPTPASEAEGGS